MAKRINVEVWVAVNSEGDYTVGDSDDAATVAMQDTNGLGQGMRLINITLSVPLPVPVEVSGTVADDGETAELIEAK